VEFGLSWIDDIGLDLIQQHVQRLTGSMLAGLSALRHGNGQPMTWLHGPSDTRDRGGTVTFSLMDPYGQVFDVQRRGTRNRRRRGLHPHRMLLQPRCRRGRVQAHQTGRG
jgi:selenocysteine lyase/cysteine desulfurase